MTNPLDDYLRQEIKAHGPVDIGRFMSIAMGYPEHGYYMRGDPFGASGDFTTAPEISQMFGEMIGAWICDVWLQMGSPNPFILLECGPGRGTLMADILRAGSAVVEFQEAAQVHLLEISPFLKAKQKEVLSGYDVRWHETLASVPEGVPVLWVANEFFDALPIRQLERRGGLWQERVVGLNDDRSGFVFGLRPAGAELSGMVPQSLRGEDGVFEVSPVRFQFMQALCMLIRRASGAGLVIDYGPAKPGMGDTFQALYRHKSVDVLMDVGQADLTSHVDFQALENCARVQNMNVFEAVPQGAFLNALGIGVRANMLEERCDLEQKEEIKSALLRLTHPDEMGALFKVLGVLSDKTIKPAGFRG